MLTQSAAPATATERSGRGADAAARAQLPLIWASHLVVVGGFVIWFCRWVTPDIKVPLDYGGDAFVHGALIKNILETGWFLNNPSLGAPFGTSYYDFPFADDALFLLIRLIGFFAHDFGTTLNVFYGAGFVLTYAASYFVLRRLRLAPVLSITASAIFSVLPYHFFRLGHLHLAAYFIVPLVIWVALSFAGTEDQPDVPFASWISAHKGFLVIAIVAGSCGVYYAFFGAGIICLSGIVESFRRRERTAAVRAGVIGGLIFLTVIVNVSPSLLHKLRAGANPEVAVRQPVEAEIYGLNVSLMFLPQPDHRNALLRKLAAAARSQQLQYNENYYAALGIVATTGCGLLLLSSIGISMFGGARLLAGRMASLNLVLILFATVGGIGFLFSLLITPEIRAQNRSSVYVAFLSIAAFFLCIQSALKSSRFARVLDAPIAIVPCFALIALALYDQVPTTFLAARPAMQSAFERDRRFIADIERAVPPGTRILELPYVKFPESPERYQEQPYGMLRGYLHSRSLKWSYGAMRGTPGDALLASMSEQSVEEQLSAASRFGFGGIYVDRAGFSDNAKDVVQRLIVATGTQPMQTDDGQLLFFRLNPSVGQAKLPDPPAVFGSGFYPTEKSLTATWHWANGNASILMLNPTERTAAVRLRFSLDTLVPRQVAIYRDGDAVKKWTLSPSVPGTMEELRTDLAPGENRLELKTDVIGAPPGNGDPRRLSFAVRNFSYDFVP